MSGAKLPTVRSLIEPTFRALKSLGGSATNAELDEQVIREMALPEEITNIPHRRRPNQSEVEYRLKWARTRLSGAGYIESSGRGIWILTKKGAETAQISAAQVSREYRASIGRGPAVSTDEEEEDEPAEEEVRGEEWRSDIVRVLHELHPAAFERLCMRLLRESGFEQVEVTGGAGDGGIDGRGVIRIGGLLTFPVIFQCKRYANPVGPKIVRDFRGAMVGRADRGLIITTSRFTRDAKVEASRDGAPPIDLVDGDLLAEKLRDLGLGLKRTETWQVDEPFFESV
ncbi:MAG TPA: restriction endonuclease [Candidatus Thermoplasmatota archaeon]|nr:restriction endonuclease [Candidatus Thermoplasmatota archaeon]